MNQKPHLFLRWGVLVLVLAALIILSSRSQATTPTATQEYPNLSVNQISEPAMLSMLCPVRAGPLTKFASNPVVNIGATGSWNEVSVTAPSVVYYNSLYRMWYSGTNASYMSSIGYSTSPNATTWTPDGGNPVLTAVPGGTWEAGGINFPSVIWDYGASNYKMWYTGNGSGTRAIGLATSTDGIAWTKYASNPVLTKGGTGEWDENRVSNPTVSKIGTTYHMWYNVQLTSPTGIGHATSPDGITWTKDAANPVLQGQAGAWDEMMLAPSVVYDGCIYHMWYTGCTASGATCRLGYARSPDGVKWRKYGVVLPLGGVGTFDHELVGYSSAMVGSPYVRIWYTGSGADEMNRIGFAIGNSLVKFNFLPVTLK